MCELGALLRGKTGLIARLCRDHAELPELLDRARSAPQPEQAQQLARARSGVLSQLRAEDASLGESLRAFEATRRGGELHLQRVAEVERAFSDAFAARDGEERDRLLAEIGDRLQQHIDWLESEVYPRAQDTLPDDYLQRALGEYERARRNMLSA